MSNTAKPGIGVTTDDIPEEDKKKPRRDPPVISTEAKYTDEQMLGITQNLQLELAQIAFQNLDFTKATAVQAYAGVLDQLAKNAQTNIRNKQDAGANSDMLAAADRIATMFTTLSRKAGMPLVLDEPDPDIQAPELGEEDSVLENEVPGNTTIGTEILNKDDFLTPPSDEK